MNAIRKISLRCHKVNFQLTTARLLKSFLSSIGYYRHLIPNFFSIAILPNELMKRTDQRVVGMIVNCALIFRIAFVKQMCKNADHCMVYSVVKAQNEI